MPPYFVVLTGIHGAGKTSIGRYLSDQGHRFEEEIPQQLIDCEEYQFDTKSSISFQKAIFRHEAARDRELISNQANAVIESWHLAAIAHSEQKANQSVVTAQKSYLSTFLSNTQVNIHPVHISITIEEMIKRSDLISNEEEKQDFINYYIDVRDNLYSLYDNFGLDHLEIQNNEGSFEEACRQIEDYIRQI